MVRSYAYNPTSRWSGVMAGVVVVKNTAIIVEIVECFTSPGLTYSEDD